MGIGFIEVKAYVFGSIGIQARGDGGYAKICLEYIEREVSLLQPASSLLAFDIIIS